MEIKNFNEKLLTNDPYEKQVDVEKKKDIYDLDAKIKELVTPQGVQFPSQVVGCGGGQTITACSGGCCQSLCSSC